jgi:hypothetical protein
VLENWETIAQWEEKQLLPLLAKIGTLLSAPSTRNILCQPSKFKPNIVIANLSRAKLGDFNAKLFGYLLATQAVGPLYIHDLGFFASDHLTPLFPQNRTTVTLRFLNELTPKLRQEVMAIECMGVYRTSPHDAKELAFNMGVLNHRKLTEDGLTLQGITIPPAPKLENSLEAVVLRSRAKNTRPRELVEAQVRRFLAS